MKLFGRWSLQPYESYFLQELKLAVCGSQIVGLVPLEAMLLAADYYIEKEDLFIVGEDQKIRLVSLWSVVIQSTSVQRYDLS